MIELCKNYLIQVLKSIGVNDVSDDPEDLAKYTPLPYAVVWQEKPEPLARDGSRVGKEDNVTTMTRTYRRRVYQRDLELMLLLIDRSGDAVDLRLVDFLAKLDSRILDTNNNAIQIEAVSQVPVAVDKSLLNQKASILVTIRCHGGVYVDKVVKLVDTAIPEPEIVK